MMLARSLNVVLDGGFCSELRKTVTARCPRIIMMSCNKSHLRCSGILMISSRTMVKRCASTIATEALMMLHWPNTADYSISCLISYQTAASPPVIPVHQLPSSLFNNWQIPSLLCKSFTSSRATLTWLSMTTPPHWRKKHKCLLPKQQHQFINWKMQLNKEEENEALSRKYIVRIYFSFLYFRGLLKLQRDQLWLCSINVYN